MLEFKEERKKVPFMELNFQSKDNAKKFIETSENYYKECIRIACDVAIEKSKNIILLTGPSSSGKTTTSILLSNEFIARGKKAVRISLDNFYKNREELPLWEDGSRNYEIIEGLDLEYFDEIICELMEKGRATFPIFDFSMGRRSEHTFEVDYDDDTFIIFEGIHALNPIFGKVLHVRKCTRLYVSPHSDFVDKDGNVVLSGRDLRLIRRLLRDSAERATPPNFTLDLWGKVLIGEEKYIRPFRKHADLHINSTHYYEPMVYKRALMRLVSGFKDEKFTQLRNSLAQFEDLPVRMIPSTSLLREFISENQNSGMSWEHSREL